MNERKESKKGKEGKGKGKRRKEGRLIIIGESIDCLLEKKPNNPAPKDEPQQTTCLSTTGGPWGKGISSPSKC